ncbi:MAG: glycosyltransferase family 39 protein [Planctomycetes bacterium]|nr:glycosyltransferase family 39 protein [Planctomycetota bacterium]MCB9885504.1 glycosyltransferase family 39 protein [Planctomycetota bacterium]
MRSPLWLLVALGCLLRLLGLTVHSLWYDECATIHVATATDPIAALHGDRHPPLTFLAFRLWIQWFGEDDFALRLLPALISCVTLALFASIARRWLAPRAALVATALQATSAFAIWHGQEVRMYAFVELATVVAVSGFARVEAGRKSTGAMLVCVGTFLGLGSHYFGGAVTAQIAALTLVRRTPRGTRGLTVAAAAIGALLWLPWMWQVIPDQLATPWAFQSRLSATELARLPVRLLLIQLSSLPTFLVYNAAGLIGLGLLSCLCGLRRQRLDRTLLTLMATPIALALAMALVAPANFAPNYLIAAAPWCAMAVASGLSRLPARLHLLGYALPAATLAACLLLRQENLREDYRSACAEALAALRPGDLLVSVTGSPEPFSRAPLQHYLRALPDLEQRLVDPVQARARLEDPAFTADLHVVYRVADYAAPLLDSLRAVGDVAQKGPVRYRVQHLVVAPRAR